MIIIGVCNTTNDTFQQKYGKYYIVKENIDDLGNRVLLYFCRDKQWRKMCFISEEKHGWYHKDMLLLENFLIACNTNNETT